MPFKKRNWQYLHQLLLQNDQLSRSNITTGPPLEPSGGERHLLPSKLFKASNSISLETHRTNGTSLCVMVGSQCTKCGQDAESPTDKTFHLPPFGLRRTDSWFQAGKMLVKFSDPKFWMEVVLTNPFQTQLKTSLI